MKLRSLKQETIVLASEAPWRSDILKQLGLRHQCVAHRYNEALYHSGSLVDFVKNTAKLKGQSLKQDYVDSFIISADQLISISDEVLYKPGTPEKAVEQLMKLNGKRHELICAVAIFYRDQFEVKAEKAHLQMRSLSLAEIENYVFRDKPWDCAGSYKIESLGSSLFEGIETKDPTTIIGIPGNLLISILRGWGFSNLL